MADKTLTRADLSEVVYRKVGLSRRESLQLVEMIIEEMSRAAVGGDDIKLSGFGVFHVRDKKERIGRNPKTGIDTPITPRRVMTFSASRILKNKITEAHARRQKP